MSGNELPKGIFSIGKGDEQAYLAFEVADQKVLTLLHTQVPQNLRGQGIANKLALMAFEHARTHDLEVEVICPVAYHFLTKHPEFRPLISLPTLGRALEHHSTI